MNFGSELEQKCYIVSKRLLYLGPLLLGGAFSTPGMEALLSSTFESKCQGPLGQRYDGTSGICR